MARFDLLTRFPRIWLLIEGGPMVVGWLELIRAAEIEL